MHKRAAAVLASVAVIGATVSASTAEANHTIKNAFWTETRNADITSSTSATLSPAQTEAGGILTGDFNITESTTTYDTGDAVRLDVANTDPTSVTKMTVHWAPLQGFPNTYTDEVTGSGVIRVYNDGQHNEFNSAGAISKIVIEHMYDGTNPVPPPPSVSTVTNLRKFDVGDNQTHPISFFTEVNTRVYHVSTNRPACGKIDINVARPSLGARESTSSSGNWRVSLDGVQQFNRSIPLGGNDEYNRGFLEDSGPREIIVRNESGGIIKDTTVLTNCQP